MTGIGDLFTELARAECDEFDFAFAAECTWLRTTATNRDRATRSYYTRMANPETREAIRASKRTWWRANQKRLRRRLEANPVALEAYRKKQRDRERERRARARAA